MNEYEGMLNERIVEHCMGMLRRALDEIEPTEKIKNVKSIGLDFHMNPGHGRVVLNTNYGLYIEPWLNRPLSGSGRVGTEINISFLAHSEELGIDDQVLIAQAVLDNLIRCLRLVEYKMAKALAEDIGL